MSISTNIATPAQTRLYISPLSPSLLPSVLPVSLQQSAVNISYHTLETFPANKYGYLELPAEDAQKIRKKFNGVFLRGMKVRVEEARPDKKRKARSDELESAAAGSSEVAKEAEQRVPKKAKKDKHKDGVLPAVELPQGREVKRGWVQPATNSKEDKRKRKNSEEEKTVKSKKSEMLFRTNLPPNVASKALTKTGEKKEKSSKDDKERRKRKGKGGKEVEVKEFSKTTKYPTFLRSTQVSQEGSKASQYLDGVGWVDGDGKVLETVSTRSTRRKVKSPELTVPAITAEAEDSTLEDEHEEEPKDGLEREQEDMEVEAPQNTKSFAPDIAREGMDAMPSPASPSASTIQSTTGSKSTISDPTVTKETTPTPSLPREVHPLEALFKRPPPSTAGTPNPNPKPVPTRPSPIVTSFSFFGGESGVGDVDEAATELHPPQTPFTQRDLQYRGQRSAAPTPDTAAVGKKMGVPWLTGDGDGGDDKEEEEEDDDEGEEEHDVDDVAAQIKANAEEETDLSRTHEEIGAAISHDGSVLDDGTAAATAAVFPVAQAVAEAQAQSDFEKHFWEHRGEYNRGWKARKREARKGVRQSENRRGIR